MGRSGKGPTAGTAGAPLAEPGRRRFWRELLGQAAVLGDELRGLPQQSLRDIGSVPDAVLAEMVPVWMAGAAMEIRADGIYRLQETAAAVRLHAFEPGERAMVDQYACGRNLAVIAREVAPSLGVDRAAAFLATKALFVRLCQMGLCHPAAAHLQS